MLVRWIKNFFKKKYRKCNLHNVNHNICKCNHKENVTKYLIKNSHKFELDKINIIVVDGVTYKVRDVGSIIINNK